jgi:hypothetical protein
VLADLAFPPMRCPMQKFLSKARNNTELQGDFFDHFLPGVHIIDSDKPAKDWVKFLRISIAAIRLAEYDYLSSQTGKDFQTAKAFLFGKNNIFSTVCTLLKINQNMALLKIISFKKSGIVGDPIFSSLASEWTEKESLILNPTSEDIDNVWKE